MYCLLGFPPTLQNLKSEKNEFPGLQKSWEKEKDVNVLENPGNFSTIHMKLELSIFLEEMNELKPFLPQNTVLENLNFDLKKSWKCP